MKQFSSSALSKVCKLTAADSLLQKVHEVSKERRQFSDFCCFGGGGRKDLTNSYIHPTFLWSIAVKIQCILGQLWPHVYSAFL